MTWPASSNVVKFPGNTRLATVTPIRPAVDQPTEADRVRALLALAHRIAAATDPLHPLEQSDLTGTDRVLIALELPNLPDVDAREKFLGIVRELHEAELTEKVDPRETDYVSQEDHINCAESLARDAVAADAAGAA